MGQLQVRRRHLQADHRGDQDVGLVGVAGFGVEHGEGGVEPLAIERELGAAVPERGEEDGEHGGGALARVGGNLLPAGLQIWGGDPRRVDRVAGGDEGGQRPKLFLALTDEARGQRLVHVEGGLGALLFGDVERDLLAAGNQGAEPHRGVRRQPLQSLVEEEVTHVPPLPPLGWASCACTTPCSGAWTLVLDADRDGLGVLGEPAHAVAAHVLDQRHQRLALLGERVLDPRRHLREGVAGDDALGFQRPQAQREGARADPLQRALQLAEAARALGQVADDRGASTCRRRRRRCDTRDRWSCEIALIILGEWSKNLASGSVAP